MKCLMFGYCLIPRCRFPIRVGWFPNHPFWDSESSLVSRWHATEVVLHWCLQSVFMFCFCIFWGNGILPATQELGVLGLWDAEHVDIPGQNPEAVWMTGAHPVKWQRPGSWEAQEIRRQRRRRVVLFEVSSSCTSFLAPKFLGRKAVGLEVLVTELGRGPSSSNLRSELLERKRCLNTTLCEKYHNQFGNRGGDSRLRLRFVISAYFRYIFSSDHPLVANASSSTTLRLSPWNTCIVYYIHTIFPRSSFVLLYFPVGSNLLYTGNCNTGGSWFFSVKLESSSLKPLHSNFFRVKENIADKGVNT
jgi:hypothetical protein